jgi:3-oxoacyl-[acyl-carrier protein] reductase
MDMLKTKTVVITGCIKGIGRATMDFFARNGANIFACAQMQDQEFEEHISSLQQEAQVDITPVYFDLSSLDDVKVGMRSILQSKKPIDALVNIAGVTDNALFHMTSIDQMKKLFDIDFFSQIVIMQMLSKVMMKQKRGSIINVSSITATDGNAGQVSYSAAKAALIGASKTLSIELGQYNIRVNVVSPGVIETDMTKALPEDKLNDLLNKAKIKRIGLPNEVAETLLFLASDASSYITGENIRVSGGI